MTLEQWLVAQLRTIDGIGDRVYADVLKQSATLPAVVYQQISHDTMVMRRMDDDLLRNLVNVRMQLDGWAQRASERNDLSRNLKALALRMRQPQEAPYILRCWVAGEQYMRDPELGYFRARVDVRIVYHEVLDAAIAA